MSPKRIALSHPKQRPLLTDMLPYEVPLAFSNAGFYRFCRKYNVEFDRGSIVWEASNASADALIRLVFGIRTAASATQTSKRMWGREINIRRFDSSDVVFRTIPFQFKITHKSDARVLSVVHPINQFSMADFYAKYWSLITYYCSLSNFSIRKPILVARYAYFNDKLHADTLDKHGKGVEESGREYEQIGSYFVYKDYSNIHQFFESYKYHRAEKRCDGMMQIDINKCFDSIYTHSIAWAVLGKSQTKFSLDELKGAFSHNFDRLMQNANHAETNGIVIGPEFSRIFAEIILQSIDVELEQVLLSGSNLVHKVDYQIFRYVDDYFVFYNSQSTALKVLEELHVVLAAKKMSINVSKLKYYRKPVITELTMAKNRIRDLLNIEMAEEALLVVLDVNGIEQFQFVGRMRSNRLIIAFKAILSENKVEYSDVMNFVFSIVERRCEQTFKCYLQSQQLESDQRAFVKYLVGVLEFCFFTYSATPRVNQTIRLCRIISRMVGFLHKHVGTSDLKHIVFKFVHDNIQHELQKNRVSSHKEVESQYLLFCLKQTGRDYWLPQSVLAQHFQIEEISGSFMRKQSLSYFSITTLINYIGMKKRYAELMAFIEDECLSKIKFMEKHSSNDTETLMLALDILVCPFVTDWLKDEIGKVFKLDPAERVNLGLVHNEWFTSWGDRLNIPKELDAKRSRQVY